MVKSKPKRNIRAQRKFAQGAFIPPHISSIASAASKFSRASITHSVPGPIIQNEINPSDFLGRLSLQRIHLHPEEAMQYNFLQPKVFLTRFTSTPTPTTTPGSIIKRRKSIPRKCNQKKISLLQRQKTQKTSSSDSSEEDQPLINFTTSDRSDRLETTLESHEHSNNDDTSIRTEGYATRSTAADKRETAILTDNSNRAMEKKSRKYRASESPSNFSDWPVPELLRAIRFKRVSTDRSSTYSSTSDTSETSSSIFNDDEADPDFQVTRPYSSNSRLIKTKTPVNVIPKKKPGRGRKRGRPARSDRGKVSTPTSAEVNSSGMQSDDDNELARNSPVPQASAVNMEASADLSDTMQNDGAEVTFESSPSANHADQTTFKRPNDPERCVGPAEICASRQFICLQSLLSMAYKFKKYLCNVCCRCILVKEYTSVMEVMPISQPEERDVLDVPECDVYDFDEDEEPEANPHLERRGRERVKRVLSTKTLILWLCSSITTFNKSMFIDAHKLGKFKRNLILPQDNDDVIYKVLSRLDYLQKCLDEDRKEIYADVMRHKLMRSLEERTGYNAKRTSNKSPPPKPCSSNALLTPVPCVGKIRLIFPIPLRPAKKGTPNSERVVDHIILTKNWLQEIANERRINAAFAGGPSTRRERSSATTKSTAPHHFIIPNLDRYPISLEFPEDIISAEDYSEFKFGVPKMLTSVVRGKVIDAPTYHPTLEDFRDPLKFIKKIEPVASKYGICKIIPPKGFKIPCHLDETVAFRTTNQNVGRLYQRWGHASKELAIIQIHVAMSEKFPNTKVPMFQGVEVDLLKLHRLVQQHGGLQELMEDKEKWAAVADEMSLVSQRGRGRGDDKLQKIYMRHVLPYASLTAEDHAKISVAVDRVWQERFQRSLARARRPLHDLRRLIGETMSSDEDADENTSYDITTIAIRKIGKPMFDRIEECTTKGQNMTLQMFRRVARQLHAMHFPKQPKPSVREVEKAYWEIVTSGKHHVCVQTAAIDTSVNNLGHESDPSAPGGDHPWNLKRISNNPLNILRSLGQFLSVTVPTLCLNQLFSTNCWHMDPHKLSWTDFMHEGPTKIWYAVARHDELKFRTACEMLVPTAVQNKGLWLPSDTAMVPLSLLMIQGCRLQRVEQNPGEFIVVFPGAYASSIATGMTISESIYFEDKTWLSHIDNIFQELRLDSEPAMFSSAELLIRMAFDKDIDTSLLPRVYDSLKAIVDEEIAERAQAREYLFYVDHDPEGSSSTPKTWPYQEECTTCRVSLVLSKTHRPEDPRLLLCLRHGLRLWELVQRAGRLRLVPPDLVLLYTDEQLEAILEAILDRITSTREEETSS